MLEPALNTDGVGYLRELGAWAATNIENIEESRRSSNRLPAAERVELTCIT